MVLYFTEYVSLYESGPSSNVCYTGYYCSSGVLALGYYYFIGTLTNALLLQSANNSLFNSHTALVE